MDAFPLAMGLMDFGSHRGNDDFFSGKIYMLRIPSDPVYYIGATLMSMDDVLLEHIHLSDISDSIERSKDKVINYMHAKGSDRFTVTLMHIVMLENSETGFNKLIDLHTDYVICWGPYLNLCGHECVMNDDPNHSCGEDHGWHEFMCSSELDLISTRNIDESIVMFANKHKFYRNRLKTPDLFEREFIGPINMSLV